MYVVSRILFREALNLNRIIDIYKRNHAYAMSTNSKDLRLPTEKHLSDINLRVA